MLSNRKGFTLIELLIVVVIIGILAAIAIPKFASTKEKAYIGAMKSDLKNLGPAQEGFLADSGYYKAQATVTQAAPLKATATETIFVPSANVTLVVEANPAPVGGQPGWRAVASHVSTGARCGIFHNWATPAAVTVPNEDEPFCR